MTTCSTCGGGGQVRFSQGFFTDLERTRRPGLGMFRPVTWCLWAKALAIRRLGQGGGTGPEKDHRHQKTEDVLVAHGVQLSRV